MLSIDPGCRIWLCTQPTDLRRSFDVLSALVRNHLVADPGSGDWLVFINRPAIQIKLPAFEEGVLCVEQALQAGLVRGSRGSGQCQTQPVRTEFLALIEGVDPYAYLVDVLQRISEHPASRVVELTPRVWKTKFSNDPMKSGLALADQ